MPRNGEPLVGAVPQGDGTYTCQECGTEGAAASECTNDHPADGGNPCQEGNVHWCMGNLNAVIHPDVPNTYTCRADMPPEMKQKKRRLFNQRA